MAQAKKFGAFSGVFTPSILTILGVIMYLRLPSIVGQAGLWTTVGIIIVAHIISISTGLSVASIATDKKVEAGGTYYMISRSLGLPIGGTLGLALFVGLSFSVSLYVIGFSESFLSYWGWEVTKDTIRLAGSITLLVVTVITLISTSLALRMQFFIMAAIVLSLISIAFGTHDFQPEAPLLNSLPDAAPFIVLFGIFFPAVTGFEAGVSMSGDLGDPKRDIPKGTLWAIGVGLVVYLILAVFFSYTVSAEQLASNPNVLLDIALFAPAVVAGIWGATISSALGSILGAPRILQATAVDRITPHFFARGHGKENEPRNALILTFIIAEAGILIGELDVIARIVSMFFITTYGFLNLSCAIESWASPDYRPAFQIPKSVSIVGALACFVVMIQLDFIAMIGATVLLGVVFLYLKRRELTLESGDTWEGFWSSLVRTGLQRLAQNRVHERNWRPNIILFSGNTEARPHLITLGRWLVYKRGLLSNFDLTENTSAKRLTPRTASSRTEAVPEEEAGVFTRRLECPDIYDAMEAIASYHGFSGVEPNTVILGWARNTRHPQRFAALVHTFNTLDLNVLLLDYDKARGYGNHQRIDVWWRGGNNNLALKLALLRFLTTSDVWRTAQIRLLTINEGETALQDAIHARVDGILASFRINATVKVINNVVDRKPVTQIISAESVDADLTLMGLPDVRIDSAHAYVESTQTMNNILGTVLFVHASSFFQEIKLGIDTSAVARGVLPQELPEALSLPPLILPEDETLQWAMQHLQDRLAQAGSELETALGQLYRIHQALQQQALDTLQNNVRSLERTLLGMPPPRARKALQRVHSSVLFHLQRALSSFLEDQLPLEQEVFEQALVALRSRLRDVLRQTPEALTITTTVPVRRSQRTRQTTVEVAFRAWVEHLLMHDFQQVVARLLTTLGLATHETVHRLQTITRNTIDTLDRLEVLLGDETALTTSLDEAVATIQTQSDEAREHLAAHLHQLPPTFQTETHQLLQTWVETLMKAVAQKQTKPRHKPASSHADRLAELPERWTSNHRQVLVRAGVSLQLLAMHQRLATLLQRRTDEFQQQVQNAVVFPVAQLHATLHQFADDAAEATPPTLRTTYDGKPVDPKPFLETLSHDIRALVEPLAPQQDMITEMALQTLASDPFADVETVPISFRRAVEYIVETELLGPLQAELAAWPLQVQQIHAIAQDVLRLVTFQVSDEDNEEVPTQTSLATIMAASLDRLAHEKGQMENHLTALSHFINARLQATAQQLNTYALSRSEGQLQQNIRGHRGRQVRSRLQNQQARLQSLVSDRVVRLLYQRSEGVLLARRFGDAVPAYETQAEHGLALREAVSPTDAVLRALPFYYRQLFLGTPSLSNDLWVGGEEARAQASAAIERYRRGFRGAILVVGEARAGKTTLSQLIAHTHFKSEHIFQIMPPEGGSIDVNEWERRFQAAVGIQGDIDTCFRQLPLGSVLLIHDLEQWWERSPDGFVVLKVLLQWIDRYSEHCLFILNADTHAFRLIDKIRPLSDQLLQVIICAPCNAEQLKEVILLRHRSTGLKLELDGEQEDNLSEWKLAKLFTAFFDTSRGNVGVALQTWISQIQKVSHDTLTITPPVPPAVNVLDELAPLQRVLLVHLLLHGSVSHTRLLRISGLPEDVLQTEMDVLQRSGLVDTPAPGTWLVNPFMRPYLTQAFTDRRML